MTFPWRTRAFTPADPEPSPCPAPTNSAAEPKNEIVENGIAPISVNQTDDEGLRRANSERLSERRQMNRPTRHPSSPDDRVQLRGTGLLAPAQRTALARAQCPRQPP